jgi:RHS repeat-associated protein
VVQVTTGANVAQYAYDGEGRRIGKTASGVTTVYVYDAGGDLAAEYSQGGTPESGRRYLTADHLGSTRLVTNGSGGVRQRIDYFPFGQEIPASEAFGNRDQITGYADTVDIPHQSATQEFTGKERDAETGLDYFEARYMSSAQGRFTSPDPSNLSVDFWYPQSWNRYAYSLNNPLAVVDRNGLWPTWVHNEIINEAFPGLSKDQLQNLQTASKNVDSDQSLAGSYKHGMANGQDPNGTVHAEMDSDEFISNNLHDAKSIQAAWIASGHTGIAPGALTAFGNALHTITDKTSPSHQYFQPWYGMGLFDLPEAGYHFVREAWPWGGNQQRQQNAVDAARQYFLLTFGSDTAAQAETPKKPKVKSKICYQTDNGLVCQQ